MILFDKSLLDDELRDARLAAAHGGALPNFPAATADHQAGAGRAPSLPAGGEPALLPDVQSASEAEAWSRRLDDGAVDARSGVVLWVDSLWGAFEIDVILHALREHVADVRCDDDGFLYRFIEAFQSSPAFVLPDRDDMNTDTHFLRSFHRLVETACGRSGVAFHGTRPPVPGVDDVRIEAADLLLVPRGRITERGIRLNIRLALSYLCRDEDPADAGEASLQARSTARLAAAQLWQWVRHETGVLDVGRIVTPALFRSLLEDVLDEFDGDERCRPEANTLSATVLGESFTMHAFCDTAAEPGGKKP